MSDGPIFPSVPAPLMSALKARDMGRAFQGWAVYLREHGLDGEARIAERRAQFWLTYALTLAAVPPGAIDKHES